MSMNAAVVTPNQFQGSDVERINQAIAAAARSGACAVIPKINEGSAARDLWLIDAAILLPGDVTVELANCHIKLSDRCRDNMFRSANCGLGIREIRPLANIHIRGRGHAVLEGADRPRATGDGAKTLGEQSYGTDAGVAGESQTGDWRNIGILLACVTRFSIENITVRDSHCWGISLEYCAEGRLRDIDFASQGSKVIDDQPRTILNQDGIDLRQGCHDILIENITGYTGDDLIALTAIPRPAGALAGDTTSTMVSGSDRDEGIHHVIIRNVKGHCRGGHHIVRFLNAAGLPMHDILLDGLIDTSASERQCRAAVKIGDRNPRWGGVTPVGDTARIMIHNVVSRSRETILIEGSLSESLISNVMKYEGPGEPVAFASGPEQVRNVQIVNAHNVTV